MNGPEYRSFTLKSNSGLLPILSTACHICVGFDPSALPNPAPAFLPFTAIWDTGATNTCITQKVVDACGLKPIGRARVGHAGGFLDTERYMINLGLPTGVAFANLVVTRSILADGGPQVLIGMDVITQGDFSVTGKNGRTVFSFRVPSALETDFVVERPKLHGVHLTGGRGGFSGGKLPRHKK